MDTFSPYLGCIYGLVVAINELRRRGCSGELRVHGISTRVRMHACRMCARVETKRNTRVTGRWCTRRTCTSAALYVSSLALALQDCACPNHFSSAQLSSIEVAASVRQGPEYSSLGRCLSEKAGKFDEEVSWSGWFRN